MWKRPSDDKADPVTRTRALETPDGPSGLEQVSKNKKIYENQVPHCSRKEPAVSPWERLGWASSLGPGIRWTAGGSQCSKYTHREDRQTQRRHGTGVCLHGGDTRALAAPADGTVQKRPVPASAPGTSSLRSDHQDPGLPMGNAAGVWGLPWPLKAGLYSEKSRHVSKRQIRDDRSHNGCSRRNSHASTLIEIDIGK